MRRGTSHVSPPRLTARESRPSITSRIHALPGPIIYSGRKFYSTAAPRPADGSLTRLVPGASLQDARESIATVTNRFAGAAKRIGIETNGAGRLRNLPGLHADVCPHVGEEQIAGLFEAVSPLRLGEEQELPHGPNEVGLVRGRRQVLFPEELPVAVEHSVQVVGSARRNRLPWIYLESHNHGIHVFILLVSPFERQSPPKNAARRVDSVSGGGILRSVAAGGRCPVRE